MRLGPVAQSQPRDLTTPLDHWVNWATRLLERHIPHLQPPIQMHSMQRVFWPDGSLGDPNFPYLMPPRPQAGALMVLKDAIGQCFQFHVNADNGHLILYPMVYRANVTFKGSLEAPWEDLIPSEVDDYAERHLEGVAFPVEVPYEHLRFYLRRAACFLKDLFDDPLEGWLPVRLAPRRKLDSLEDLGTCVPNLSLDFIHHATHARRRVIFDACQRVRYVREGKALFPNPRPEAQCV